MTSITLNATIMDSNAPHVQALLEQHNLTQGRYAVEIDGMLVPKSRLADTSLTENMRIEVVQAVGGG
ncbi:MAG: sulfur carrier protein ThiS [Moraxella sp.]|nr:sulfur carrier protein ThiS [Moraxella sp.]